ncbi:AcrR family transcriptional regulator [Catenulispora sp. MAP12-49]|uniref:TetR/AcrR family transcriptional regulator n=1 Tax=unclassified Catenulispora TaxID=414885 RepID=UPI0035169543
MSRWPSNPRGRLEQAAMDLFVERGYDQTTVAEIAERAGLTERTFFRHFSDKREVLFQGGELLRATMVEALAAAPADAPPMAAVHAAVTSVAIFFDERHDMSRLRQGIIDAHPELQEREVAKMAMIALALAAGLRERGVADPDARLAADAGIAVFRSAFAQWVRSESGDMAKSMKECFAALEKLVERAG